MQRLRLQKKNVYHAAAEQGCAAVLAGAKAGPVTSVADTDDLIDMLLTVGTAKPAWIFFDIDETLVTRDTCLVHGFQHTTYLLERLRTRLAETGSSGARASEVVRKIQAEMEREYYDSDIKLVDPLLARLVRGLKVQGHHVFGLTSNEPFSEHSITTVAALAQYKIRFSDPWIRGELPLCALLFVAEITTIAS
ncbi:hypothetical protein JKP88DRAFT_319451 [Tribonema minus]|uniref:Uncharacterized protein n=1 Tax=Tribonema minus TaxID=303371 RepID=A0A835YVM2_9STRA|nr:hypothetical protein JKP88DRAFT_319451 [Tribonema minus]